MTTTSSRLSSLRTNLGATIEMPGFRAKAPEFEPARAAAGELAALLKPSAASPAYVRFSPGFHESNWEPSAPYGYPQLPPILRLLRERGLRPLMVVVPHYWPGSEWQAPWDPARDWGAPKPDAFPLLAIRYRELVATYRAEGARAGFKDSELAIQWGNEPAAGHPGGDGRAPRGTWSAQGLWNLLHGEFRPEYGALAVIAPALSMLDQPTGALELRTARAGAESWAGPVTRWAMHFRHHRPALGGAAYARSYVEEMGRRARLVLGAFADVPASKAKAESRARLWVTEAYVAEGDLAGERAPAIAEINRLLLAGAVPEVQHLLWYRVHPLDGADRTFAFSAKSLVAATAPPVAEGA